jgi:hypothetical protein
MARGVATHADKFATSDLMVNVLCELVRTPKDSRGRFQFSTIIHKFLKQGHPVAHILDDLERKYAIAEWCGADNPKFHRLTPIINDTLDELGEILKRQKRKFVDPRIGLVKPKVELHVPIIEDDDIDGEEPVEEFDDTQDDTEVEAQDEGQDESNDDGGSGDGGEVDLEPSPNAKPKRKRSKK